MFPTCIVKTTSTSNLEDNLQYLFGFNQHHHGRNMASEKQTRFVRRKTIWYFFHHSPKRHEADLALSFETYSRHLEKSSRTKPIDQHGRESDRNEETPDLQHSFDHGLFT
ncbi:hypothetical protein AC578_9823 [Pseudocercospora eumusae]|uniref:Uncharacterized protein n=1 Tax=Pseudocercospora eumusae TaxID=321146 RepID=A0A139H9N3_9PEZI|nr:hypothetical protein AC578_9823 [Pseudocercospora eumusae]